MEGLFDRAGDELHGVIIGHAVIDFSISQFKNGLLLLACLEGTHLVPFAAAKYDFSDFR